jgi:hypothetical protein
MNFQSVSLFDQFWSHYPARNGRPKVGKQPTLLLFRELDESEQADCVQAGMFQVYSSPHASRRAVAGRLDEHHEQRD